MSAKTNSSGALALKIVVFGNGILDCFPARQLWQSWVGRVIGGSPSTKFFVAIFFQETIVQVAISEVP